MAKRTNMEGNASALHSRFQFQPTTRCRNVTKFPSLVYPAGRGGGAIVTLDITSTKKDRMSDRRRHQRVADCRHPVRVGTGHERKESDIQGPSFPPCDHARAVVRKVSAVRERGWRRAPCPIFVID